MDGKAAAFIPNRAGVGLKPEHCEQALACVTDGLWFEVHTENYFVAGGPRMEQLTAIREQRPLSFHGVGASLGGPQPPDAGHLARVAALVERYEPGLVSEHAVWSRFGATYYADLLPLPRTRDALQRLVDGVELYQATLGRTILLENPTNYLPFISEMDEPEFLLEVARQTGCGLLLDVNNLYLSAHNCNLDARAYIRALPPGVVGEIHVAGYDPDPNFGAQLLIDSHAAPVSEPVWELLEFALRQLGPTPVLLERDANLPPFGQLLEERNVADSLAAGAGTERKHGHA